MGGLAAALLWCAEAPATAPATGPQDQPSPLELARAALDQPGADHRLPRENAVKTLLSMTGQPAHIALQDRLRGGDDTDGVSRYILEELDRRISHPNDSLFGISNGDAGAMLLKSYVPALVSAFIEEGPDAEVGKHRRLRVKALGCLLHMPARARLEGLQAMLAPGIQDLEMQRAALRAAASCRETGLARLLGDQLQGDLSEIAQQGLKQLTFENFGTGREGKTDFDKWWEENSGKTYLELVENVARIAEAVQDEQNDKLIKTQVQLLEALVSQQTVKWQNIHELVLADDPTGAMRACLTKLADILQFKDYDGNAVEARIEFHSALRQRFPEAKIEEKVLLLEIAAYLIRPQEDRERKEMEAVLVQELGSEYLVLRLAALRGLQRFPSPANRAAVVRVAKDSLASSGQDELTTLIMALGTLHRPGWHAPSPAETDYPEWIQVLRQVFYRTDASELLEEGIDVALVADEGGGHLTEVFGLLMELAAAPEVEINHRIKVLLTIGAFITSENADSYLTSVLNLLDDDRFEIRVKAAQLLAELPEPRDIEMEEWLLQVRQKVAGRLPHEMHEEVFQALVDCLYGLSNNHPENVIAIFKNAMEILPENQVSHREIVITALTKLGLRTDLEVVQWQIAADVLLENDHRDAALAILSKHQAGDLAGQAPEDVQRGLELLVRAALRKPAGPSLHSEAEALQVLAAFAKLDTDFGVVQNDLAHQLLRIQLHNVLEHNGDIIGLGSSFLQGGAALSAELRDQVLILMARAQLREGEAEDARQTMERLSETGAKTIPALAVCHQIGKRLMTQESSAARAVDVLTKVVDDTRPEADEYRERFLDLVEATLTADPGKRTEVAQMLEAKKPLFEADDCPPDEKARFDKLLEAASA